MEREILKALLFILTWSSGPEASKTGIGSEDMDIGIWYVQFEACAVVPN